MTCRTAAFHFVLGAESECRVRMMGVLTFEVDWIARTMLRPRVGDVPPAMATMGILYSYGGLRDSVDVLQLQRWARGGREGVKPCCR